MLARPSRHHFVTINLKGFISYKKHYFDSLWLFSYWGVVFKHNHLPLKNMLQLYDDEIVSRFLIWLRNRLLSAG